MHASLGTLNNDHERALSIAVVQDGVLGVFVAELPCVDKFDILKPVAIEDIR